MVMRTLRVKWSLLLLYSTFVCLVQGFLPVRFDAYPSYASNGGVFPVEIMDRFNDLTQLLQNVTPVVPGDAYDLMRMFDASGKPGSGILTGNTQFLGDFDECLLVGSDVAHYCLYSGNVTVNSTLPMTNYTLKLNVPLLRWGLCVNASESGYALNSTITTELEKIGILTTKSSVVCYKEDSFSGSTIFVISLFSLIGALVLLSTIYDVVCSEMRTNRAPLHVQENTAGLSNGVTKGELAGASDSSETTQLLRSVGNLQASKFTDGSTSRLHSFFFAFSMARNLPKLLDTVAQAKSIQCLHGMRAISMFWIILGHTYYSNLYTMNIANPLNATKIVEQFAFQAVATAFLAVDTFFFISGLLVMYLLYPRLESTSGRFPWISYYVHRYWRLTPTYFFGMLILWQLLPYLADGPYWDYLVPDFATNQCDKYWWTNILYINNFYPNFRTQCMEWTWYLANDMQMYILTPAIVIPTYIFGTVGLLATAGFCLGCVFIVITTLSAINGFPANAMLNQDAALIPEYTDKIYEKFYTRAAPYLVGLFLGYCLARKDHLSQGALFKWMQKQKRVLVPVAWVWAFIVALVVVYGLYGYNRGHSYAEALSVLYLTFSSFLWAVCLATLVFLCHSGHGGLINTILSWKVLVPLSRLTYSAYLLHPIILAYLTLSDRAPLYVSHSVIVFRFVGVLGLSYLSALLLSLCIEYPCAAIEKVFHKRKG